MLKPLASGPMFILGPDSLFILRTTKEGAGLEFQEVKTKSTPPQGLTGLETVFFLTREA